jgi:hypothetical protein
VTDRGRTRAGLVYAATTISVIALVISGLLLRDFAGRVSEDPGYEPDRLVSVKVRVPSDAYPTLVARAALWQRLLASVAGVHGVVSATLASELPTTGLGTARGLTPAGQPGTSIISTIHVSHGYRPTVGISLIAGRWFSRHDSAEEVAVVNEAFVREYWPEMADPIGLRIQGGPATYRVVGLSRDARVSPGVSPRPKVYLLLGEAVVPFPLEIIARTHGHPGQLAGELRGLVQRLGKTCLPSFASAAKSR